MITYTPSLLPEALARAIAQMPKVELHRHLEGALRLSTLAENARAYLPDLPGEAEALRPLVQMRAAEPRTAAAFLSKFAVLRRFFISEAVVRRMAYEAVRDAADDGIVYLELRFTPNALNSQIGADLRAVIGWVCASVAEAEADAHAAGSPIVAHLIVTLNRHESVAIAEASLAAALAVRERHGRIVGLDFAGREAGNPLAPFAHLIAQARAAGLRLTLHAGEWVGPVSVAEALRYHPDRIGHGVRAAEDPSLMAVLAAHGVVLEVCPSSNIDSGVYPALAAHSLPTLRAHGVRVTLNSDDPLISGISLSDEIGRVMTACGQTLSDVQAMMRQAAQAAFAPAELRADLLARLDAFAAASRAAALE
jgi:adenosine deaminase